MNRQARPTRRAFLRTVMTTPVMATLAACVPPQVEPEPAPPSAEEAAVAPAEGSLPADTPAGATAGAQLEPTPACGDDDDEPTLAQTEGPYYTPNTPQRTSFLEPGISGTPMIVTGTVLTTDCRPIPALLDFWHCDDTGVYDNQGYKLRGHFFADEQGRYRLETIMPGLYPGRTRHFHVKVQAPNQPVLTTQLYFPGEPQNERDGIFRPELLMDVQDTDEGKIGRFDFVLNVA